jgi:hypothetical protein
MIFILSGEITSSTKIDLLRNKYAEVFLDHFKDKTYSEELNKMFVVIVCRPVFGQFKLKQRKRFERKNGVFMIDVMLDYEEIMKSDMLTKEVLFFQCFRQILPFLKKTKIKGFDSIAFERDLETLLSEYI